MVLPSSLRAHGCHGAVTNNRAAEVKRLPWPLATRSTGYCA